MTMDQNAFPLALITGASAGLGSAFADACAARGYALLLVARREERLAELRETLKQNTAAPIYLFRADLRRNQERLDLLAFMEELQLCPSLLINNAGICQFEEARELKEDASLTHLNVLAVHHLCRELLPGMHEKGGHILNIASLSGLIPLPGFPTYSASKHWLVGFGQSLNAELCGSPLSLTTCCPGLVHTELFEKSNLPSPPHGSAARAIVDSALKATFKRKALVILPLRSYMQYLFYLLLPTYLKEHLMRAIWKKTKAWKEGE